jgi:hypothetical protein
MVKSLAVVSFAVDYYSAPPILQNQARQAIQAWYNITLAPELRLLMAQESEPMLRDAEAALGRSFAVVPAERFVSSTEYRSLAMPGDGVVTPTLGQLPMPSFARDRDERVSARVAPQIAAQLAEAAHVDLIAIVYSEWSVATGGWSSSSRALTKNLLTIYDRFGAEV